MIRKVAKIARSEVVGVAKVTAARELTKLFKEKKYSIDSAYDASVAHAYAERDIDSSAQLLLTKLSGVTAAEIDPPTKELLKELRAAINRLVGT